MAGSNRRIQIYGALAVTLGALVYANSLSNPFIYDDQVHVVTKEAIRELGSILPILVRDRFRPLVNLTYAIDYAIWGLNPLGYHLTNVGIHCLNVLLLYILALGLIRDIRSRRGSEEGSSGVDLFNPRRRLTLSAAGMATLFAVHPLLSEGVGYVSGRAEILCATFFLLAFIALRQGILRSGGGRWIGLGIFALVLGLGTKEHGAMLPLVLLAYDRFILAEADPDGARRRLMRLHLPLVGLVMVAGSARIIALLWFEYDSLPRPVLQNLLMQGTVVWRYLLLIVLPVGQSVVHQVRPVTSLLDPMALGAGAALISLAALILALRRQAPLSMFGLLWFFLLLAPSSSIIPLLEPMAEHRVYLASCGLFMAAGAGFWRLLGRVDLRGPTAALIPRVILVGLIIILALATVLRNRVWRDPVTLWSDAIQNAPGVWAPHFALGDAYKGKGHCAKALKHYRAAIKILPAEHRAHLNLGICLATLNDDAEAGSVFKNVLSLDPDNIKAHNNLGQLAMRAKKWEEAEEHFKSVLRQNQKQVMALASMGVAAKMQGAGDSAVRYLEAVLRIDPTNTYALMHLGHAYETLLRNTEMALKLYQRVVALAPNTPGAAEGAHRCSERLKMR